MTLAWKLGQTCLDRIFCVAVRAVQLQELCYWLLPVQRLMLGSGGACVWARQVSKAAVTYVSERFTITRGAEYAIGPWGNCSAKCGYGLRRREVGSRARREREQA